MLLIPQTPNFAVSLTLKTRNVTECDLLPLANALTETGMKKSMFKIAPCRTSICDQCMCKTLIYLKQNSRGSSRHKISSVLYPDVGHTRMDTRTHRFIRLYPRKLSFCGSYDKQKGCCTAKTQTIHGIAKLAQSSQVWHLKNCEPVVGSKRR